MRVLTLLTALCLCSCSTGERAQAPPDLHGHMLAASKQITTISAPDSAVAAGVSGALTAKSLQVVSSELYASCGRVAAVDAHGIGCVVSWERAAAAPGGSGEPECVLLFVSRDPGAGTVSVGELAEAVRMAAESAG